MHIPSCETQKLDVLRFEEAMRDTETEEYDREKWLYVPDHYSEYRYILGTKGRRPLICIGINPSTARPDDLDNTLKSVERTARRGGYDSWMMFNVYPQRATRPDDMDRQLNPTLHEENLKAFRYVLSLCEDRPDIWAAWGTIIEKRDYLPDILLDMIQEGERFDARWWCYGKISAKGHPHHPLYLSNTAERQPFDAAGYCRLLKERQKGRTAGR